MPQIVAEIDDGAQPYGVFVVDDLFLYSRRAAVAEEISFVFKQFVGIREVCVEVVCGVERALGDDALLAFGTVAVEGGSEVDGRYVQDECGGRQLLFFMMAPSPQVVDG